MQQIKIGFVLLSSSTSPAPSTRIAALNMFPYLRQAGFEPHIVYEPTDSKETPDVSGLAERLIAAKFEIVVFQKVHGPSVEQMARELVIGGVRTVYSVCDLVNVPMAEATDVTVVVTDYLKSLYPAHLQLRIHTVHDGIEDSVTRKSSWSTHRGSPTNPLHALLVTSAALVVLPQLGIPPPWLRVTVLGRYPANLPMKARLRGAVRKLINPGNVSARIDRLRFIMSPRIDCISWRAESVAAMLMAADIGIIPIDNTSIAPPGALPMFWQRKSENRMTLNMAAGLPVVSTPIPSYLPIVEHGRNGYFANSRREWLASLETLRDPDVRQRIGEAGRATVIDSYSMDKQARDLVSVLRSLTVRPVAPLQEEALEVL